MIATWNPAEAEPIEAAGGSHFCAEDLPSMSDEELTVMANNWDTCLSMPESYYWVMVAECETRWGPGDSGYSS